MSTIQRINDNEIEELHKLELFWENRAHINATTSTIFLLACILCAIISLATSSQLLSIALIAGIVAIWLNVNSGRYTTISETYRLAQGFCPTKE